MVHILKLTNQLSIDDGEGHPTLLVIPNPKQFEHHHIELDDDAARRLQQWLYEYFSDKFEENG